MRRLTIMMADGKVTRLPVTDLMAEDAGKLFLKATNRWCRRSKHTMILTTASMSVVSVNLDHVAMMTNEAMLPEEQDA